MLFFVSSLIVPFDTKLFLLVVVAEIFVEVQEGDYPLSYKLNILGYSCVFPNDLATLQERQLFVMGQQSQWRCILTKGYHLRIQEKTSLRKCIPSSFTHCNIENIK